MKLLLHESDNCRIVQTVNVPGTFPKIFAPIIARQRKKWWGWKTTAWLYTHILKTVEEYKDRITTGEKIDNRFSSRYSRMLISLRPEFKNKFEFRRISS